MATAKRFSYSLLISTLAFAVFAVFAFSGLFPWIEAQFYSPKVVSDLQTRLDATEVMVDDWKSRNLGKLESLLSDPSFDGLFAPTASQDALQKRFQSTKLFLLGMRGGGSLRILNADRTQVHFSSEESDVKVRGDFSLTYRPVSEVADLPALSDASLGDGKVHLLADPQGQRVYFFLPWQDSQATQSGFALLGVSLEDLRLSLFEAGSVGSQQALVALAADEFLLSLLGQKLDATVIARVQAIRAQGVLPPVQRLARADGQLSVALIHQGRLNLVVPASVLELDELLKYLLLASFYTVLFLVTFLLANLRGEPLSVVTRKVKRFQLQVVRQYLDLKEQDKIQSLRDELAQHSDEIRSDVRRSLGRVRKRDQEWVDRYIDTSWQEVMDLLRGPSPPLESASNADWKRLETLLQQALTQGRFVVSGTAPVSVASHKPAEPIEELSDPESVEEVEDLDDVEELEEVEALEEAEELEEEVEDLEEVEELEEEVEDLAEVEELEEEAEDLEEVEEREEEAEDLEEVEELEANGELGKAEESNVISQALEADELELEADEVLEELDDGEPFESSDEEPNALEELPNPGPSIDFSRLRRPPSGGSPVTTLSTPDEDAEMLDDLEELDEVLEDLDDAPLGEDASFSLERLDAAWASFGAGVFDESQDVIQLKDAIFAEEAGGGDDAFGHLVDEVLAGPDGNSFVPLHEDLVPRQLSRDWKWTGGGFDWDRFALGDDEVNLFRALSEIVTQFDAFTAAILTEVDGVWRAQSSVGFSDSGKGLLAYSPEASLSRSFLSIRALHVLKGGIAHEVLRTSFHAKDLKFLKSVVCVPLLFRHEPAWLLLGLRHEPGDLIELLAPRRVD